MPRLLAVSGVAVVAMTAALPALAAEMELASRIEHVTVYPDAAIVARKAEIDLPAGATELVLKNLPLAIDPASLRVEGEATGALALGAVESRLRPVDPARVSGEREAELRDLRDSLSRVAAEADALEGRKAMILRFAQSGPDRGDRAGGLEVSQWSAAWAAVGEALAGVNEDLRRAARTKAEIEAKIRAIQLAETQGRARLAPEREFAVAVEAGAALRARLIVSYRVSGAGWRPAYDARLSTGEAGKAGGLTLARRALVSQRTGEDWTGVELTLSTVRAARGTAAPQVDPQRVAFFEIPPPVVYRPRAGAAVQSAAPAAPMAAAEAVDGAARKDKEEQPRQQAAAREASLEANGFEASYRIPGRLSLPADGAQKSFIVQSRTLQPDLLVKASPALDPTAYLEAAFVNDEEAPLLPGEVTLFRDNAFVGRGQFAFTAPGDKVSLGFGADERVRIARVPLRRRETEPSLLGSTRTDLRDFKITVKNLHDFPIKASIVDQMPFSEASNLIVEPLPTNTPPTEKTVQDRRGVMGWTYELKPKEEREIRLGYRLRYPNDREIVFERAPNPK